MRFLKSYFQSSERGQSAPEFALVSPLFFMLIFGVITLAILGYSLLITATAVPLAARQAGVHSSSAAGASTAHSIMSAIGPASQVSGAVVVRLQAPGCQRAAYARISARTWFSMPMIERLFVRMQAGSRTRDWRFWAGKPPDDCV